MKTKIFFLLIFLGFIISGCLVKSLHPFYSEKDLVYKQELLGSWIDHDSSQWVIRQHMKSTGLFKPDQPEKAYDIDYASKKGTSRFLAHLFQVDKQLYLDFFPDEINFSSDLEGFHMVATHSLAKVQLESNKIIISWYNEEWLANLFNQNKIRIHHERVPYDLDDPNQERSQVILTASTDELQKFIIKYGNDPDAFKKDENESDYTFILTRK